ncbi:MAG: hypothetical protein B6241_12940 [Spirochaetaceae bacterium 4572_59]|nr:MAG: hypothetical protein B6241_12940 [Spirochaetaceae bacterium 4572_59]
MNKTGIIPQVKKYKRNPGDFSLKELFCLKADENAAPQKSLLEGYLKECGFPEAPKGGTEKPDRQIVLRVEENSHYDEAGFCNESYQIHISPSQIKLIGKTSEGLARAVQSFRQLLYTAEDGVVPCCRIEDTPRFRWRGMHLDVSRHFFPVEDVKAFIDQLALYRFNRLHLHLTDDQ